jgi:hypothetical protein
MERYVQLWLSYLTEKSPRMQELPTLTAIQSSMQFPDISVVDSSHNSASIQKSTMNQWKIDKNSDSFLMLSKAAPA